MDERVRKISYQDQVEQAVCRKRAGRILIAASMYQESLREIPEFTYYKALERMVTRRKLIRLSRGIYIRPELSIGQDKIADEIIRYYTEPCGKKCWGVCSGDYLLEKYGLMREPRHSEKEAFILTARISEQRKCIQGITLKRLPFLPHMEEVPYLEWMELVERYDVYRGWEQFDTEAFTAFVEEIAGHYADAGLVSVLEQYHYPKRVIALAEKLLTDAGCDTSLRRFLPGTSKYRIPS